MGVQVVSAIETGRVGRGLGVVVPTVAARLLAVEATTGRSRTKKSPHLRALGVHTPSFGAGPKVAMRVG